MFDWTRGNLGFPPILNRSKNVDYLGSHCCCCDGGGCGWWWFGGCSGGRSRGGRCGSITTTGPTASRVYLIVPGAPPFVATLSSITIFTTFCGKISNKFRNSMKKNLHNIWSMRVYHRYTLNIILLVYGCYEIIAIQKKLPVISVNNCLQVRQHLILLLSL